MTTTTRMLSIGALLLGLGGTAFLLTRATHDAQTGSPAPAPQYHCAMHPTVVSDRPGTCPICGMDLVRIQAGHEQGDAADHAMNDRASVVLSEARRAVLGLRSEPVRRVTMQRTIRTVGRVAVDERRLHHIHIKFEAYIEHLHVDFTGKLVSRGEVLASVYSPELVASQQEYLLALRAQQRLGDSGIASVARGGIDLLEAARQRLRLFDIPQAEIDHLEQAGEVRRTLDIVSPVSGYVVTKMATHGMRVTPADTLFDIADLSHLWVLADVYESDLPIVSLGMTADISLSYLPDRAWQGKVTWVAPTVDPQTRTVKVRVEVNNREGHLKPEMYADVVLTAETGDGLVVPDSAIIDTGQRQLLFVDEGEGRLTPREVRVGPKSSAGTQVVSGVEAGERVVTAANFLLDSESSLKAALQTMAASPGPHSPASPPANHAGHGGH